MRVQVEQVVDDDAIRRLYPAYVEVWEALRVNAAARHVLTPAEFAAEMTDPRIDKIVVLDDPADRIVALTTVTSDLTSIPWINPDFFVARYPEAAAARALFYVGYTLVVTSHRRTGAIELMIEELDRRLRTVAGVAGVDLCTYNVERGPGRRLQRYFPSSRRIETLDTQRYLAADYRDQAGTAPVYRTVSLADHAARIGEVQELLAARWPAFMLRAQPGHEVDLTDLLLRVPEASVLVLDADDALAGAAFSVPLTWDGTAVGLPAGWDDAVSRASALLAEGGRADARCALSATVAPAAAGRGVGERLIRGLTEAAAGAGARALIAPVRPSLKTQYPLTPMGRYLTWTRGGETFDPWLRLHLRLGAEVLGVADASMTLTGSVAEWEVWLGLALPDSGTFVVPGALAPLEVDRESDVARYVEPNVWVRHVAAG